MKRFASGLILAAAFALGTGGTAVAGPTCSGSVWDNHGDHIRSDYVLPNGSAAGGDPAHRGSGTQPGASFCVSQSQSRPVQYP